MRVLVDTPVWSLALRRRARRALTPRERDLERELRELIGEGRVAMVGVIRQELLSGIRDAAAFERLRRRLRPFPDEELGVEDYEEAARSHNECRGRGITGSVTDFLLCGVALRRGLSIFTTDKDFARYARCLPIRLHAPREPA